MTGTVGGSVARAALLEAFTPTGTVDDFGRRFTGPGEIGVWSDRENIGTHKPDR